MLQSDGFGPAYRDLARREPVSARLITVYGRRTRSNGTTGDAPGLRSRTSTFDGAGRRGCGEGEPVPRNGTLMERS
jgi:hypothetical protein